MSIRDQVGHIVYRLYDEEGSLLYIGSTWNFTRRLRSHLGRTSKYPEIRDRYHHHTIQIVDSERERRRVEAFAIADEAPEFNRQHNPKRWKFVGPGLPFVPVENADHLLRRGEAA